jgi:hypothetical protein
VSSLPGAARPLRGALAWVGVPPGAVVFQYNPDTMTRRLEPMAGTEGGGKLEALRLVGPPRETITLNVEVDAVDQPDLGDPSAGFTGLEPVLASLELLVYPHSGVTLANSILAAAGVIEVIPLEAPFTLLVWGAKRVVPVRLTGFSITEEGYDVDLNPLRARLELSLHVLSTADLKLYHPGYSLFMVHQITKEMTARSSSTTALQQVGQGLHGLGLPGLGQ